MNWKEQWRANWFVVLVTTILAVLITLAASYYFFVLGKQIREPVFVVDPSKTRIVNQELLRDTDTPPKIKITRTDNTPIWGHVYATKLYLWNQGEVPIKKEDVRRKLEIIFDSPSVEILDWKITKQSRDVVGGKIDAPSNNSHINPKLYLSFDELEKDDGIAVQVIYAGGMALNIRLEGVIEGFRAPIDDAPVRSILYWKKNTFKYLITGILMLAMSLATWGRFYFGPPNIERLSTGRMFDKVGSYLSAVAVILALYLIVIEARKTDIGEYVMEAVPASLR